MEFYNYIFYDEGGVKITYNNNLTFDEVADSIRERMCLVDIYGRGCYFLVEKRYSSKSTVIYLHQNIRELYKYFGIPEEFINESGFKWV
jgi:hypothetical protein